MAVITFNIPQFRERFPAFADTATFPDARLTMQWDMAACYINPENYGYLHGACREQAIQLMTAHLLALSVLIESGSTPAMVSSSTVDKVSVSLTPPPVKSQFGWWLSLTPYGAQLLALLSMKAVGGLYVGGLPERAAFRKVGGIF
jgi:hypothetical protein